MNRLKYILFTLFVIGAFTSKAQESSIGIKGGYGFGMVNLEPARVTQMAKGFYHGGLVFNHKGVKSSVESFQIELTMSQRGYSTTPWEGSDSVTTRAFTAIELPFLWKPNYTFAKERLNIYAVLGLYGYYDINSSINYKDKKRPESDFNKTEKYKYDRFRDNRLGYGVIAGLGLGINVSKSILIAAEFRYVYGFSNVFRPAVKYPSNPVQSTTSQMTVSLGVYYKFNKHTKDKK